MASNGDIQNLTEDNEISSEDEVLSVLKSKVKKKANKRKRPPRKSYVDHEEKLMPQMFVHVEVEEVGEGPLDFSGVISKFCCVINKEILS